MRKHRSRTDIISPVNVLIGDDTSIIVRYLHIYDRLAGMKGADRNNAELRGQIVTEYFPIYERWTTRGLESNFSQARATGKGPWRHATSTTYLGRSVIPPSLGTWYRTIPCRKYLWYKYRCNDLQDCTETYAILSYLVNIKKMLPRIAVIMYDRYSRFFVAVKNFVSAGTASGRSCTIDIIRAGMIAKITFESF